MKKIICYGLWCALVIALLAVPVQADLSVFVATVAFDEDANLDNGQGIGLRWGRSSDIIGGETSLLIARPERQLLDTAETATAIFYEGRLMVNIPTGGPIKPFAGIGLGRVTITSVDPTLTDVKGDAAASAYNDALLIVADAQSNTTISYGGGANYSLNERLSLRADIRQYSVLSVASLVQDAVTDAVGDAVGDAVLEGRVKDRTVQYNELSLGLNFKF